ncbi:YgaB family protein [Heyndrickxia oleronia]|uniref:YgaB family protein n=1 Tax=Heyndrickxia oleronia TaxID=38875 RepID=A0AAW6T6D9_9BACI|nr:YgaB family protein [Heyndrickxia oleronia]MDH5164401.1 YgaB family protein [Heyndrickxia oleronia]
MKEFNELIQDQMKTMEQLLYLQNEIERCQEIEQELSKLQEETKVDQIKKEINEMKKELNEIHKIFESQTDEVIRKYQGLKETPEKALT